MAVKRYQKFPVDTTTIFPMANSQKGGQLLTEWNQLSRETVANHSNIDYVCGPSYTHSLNDFEISASGTTLKISGGTAIVHGHFVQLSKDTPISIDIAGTGLTGTLYVGLHANYSNPTTMAASLTPESDDYFQGIEVVIAPPGEFHLPEGNDPDHNPESACTPESQVNAHLLLGEINYSNGSLTATPNDQRQTCLDGDKIFNLAGLMKNQFVTRDGLDPNKWYVMAGKGRTVDRDYWTDATDSIMVWDANPQTRNVHDTVKAIWQKDEAVTGSDIIDEAVFRYDDSTNELKLVVPHKPIEGLQNMSNDLMYYEPKELVIPAANRATGEGGVLNANWVQFLNGLDNKIATMYRMPGGKMRKFIEVLTNKDDLPAPPIAYSYDPARNAAYYDNRLQYSFNLLQTQVAQLNSKFEEFLSKLETDWKNAVTADLSSQMLEQASITQSDIASLRSMLSTFQGDLSAATGQINSTSDSLVANYSTYYSTLSDRVTALENRWGPTGTPGSEDQQQDSDIEHLQQEIDAMKEQINNMVYSVNANINNTLNQITSLYNSLYGTNSSGSSGDVADAKTSIEQLRSQYDYLYDAIHDLYDGISIEIAKQTDTLYSKLFADLSSKVESLVASLAEKYNISAEWVPGDYVLVAQDQTVTTQVSDAVTFPSTMYVVVPGKTRADSREFVASYYDTYQQTLSMPIGLTDSSNASKDSWNQAIDTYSTAVDSLMRMVPAKFIYGYELGSNGVVDLGSEAELPDVYNSEVMINELYNSSALIEGVRGTPGKDYFVLRYRYPQSSTVMSGYTENGVTYADVKYQNYTWVNVFFTLSMTNWKTELDTENPIILSGGTPYAEEERVGGFLNVASDVYGSGYVSRDEAGHLRLNDFELLAAGVSAYQLGEDRSEGAGLDISEMQDIFDQYVNQRIAFPNDNQLYRAAEKGLRTDVITIDLNIGGTSEGTLNIYDIDSRFNTSVHLNITGQANENVVINITNCARMRITLDQQCNPTIFLKNVCLYYDADVIDRIASIEDLSLWYTQFEDTDPQLEVDGMTVIYQGKLDPKGTNDFWTYAAGNDNSYAYALRQVTFGSDGTIIGMGVAVTDNTTSNIMPEGDSIFASTFTLPQSIGFTYPVTRLTKQIKVTGNFITAYRTTQGTTEGYAVKNTNFTILTQKYLRFTEVKEFIQGVISFYTQTKFVKSASGVSGDTLLALSDEFAIDGWESGAYHIFYGGAVE